MSTDQNSTQRSEQDLANLASQARSNPAGDRDARLTPQVRTKLDGFKSWLRKTEGKSEATSASYRSYVVTALTNGKSWSDQTSDVRSGLRAYARYEDALKAQTKT